MARRRVTSTTHNPRGYITALCNSEEEWSPRSAEDSVLDLELGAHSYFVQWHGRNAQIEAADDASGRYLRCDTDKTGRNTLLDLDTPRMR